MVVAAQILGILDNARRLLRRTAERSPLNPLTVDELWIAYELGQKPHLGEDTWKVRAAYMVPILKFFAGKRVVLLSLPDGDCYRQWRVGQITGKNTPATQSTASYELKAFRTILNWGAKQRIYDRNPMHGIALPGANKQRTLTWKAHQVRRTAAAGSARLEAILRTLYDGGLRTKEVIKNKIGNLQMGVIEDENGNEQIVNVLLVPAEISKTHRQRLVVLQPETVAQLRDLPRKSDWLIESPRFPGRPISRNTVREWMLEAAHDAGVDGEMGERPKLHALRHSYGTDGLRAGVNPQAVMRTLGHQSLDQTSRYAHADISDQALAAAKIVDYRARRKGPKRAIRLASEKKAAVGKPGDK